jgi:hypothetical protein
MYKTIQGMGEGDLTSYLPSVLWRSGGNKIVSITPVWGWSDQVKNTYSLYFLKPILCFVDLIFITLFLSVTVIPF